MHMKRIDKERIPVKDFVVEWKEVIEKDILVRALKKLMHTKALFGVLDTKIGSSLLAGKISRVPQG